MRNLLKLAVLDGALVVFAVVLAFVIAPTIGRVLGPVLHGIPAVPERFAVRVEPDPASVVLMEFTEVLTGSPEPQVVLRVYRDGHVETSAGVDVDAQALRFWQAMAMQHAPGCGAPSPSPAR